MERLSISEVTQRRQHQDFYQVKKFIWRQHTSAAVLPLQSQESTLLDPQRHPFYQHAERTMFVAYRGRQPVGRIAAIRDFLHQEHYQDHLGTFGFFECEDDQSTADALVAAATEWLQTRGCDRLRGPLNPSMKGEFGVLVEGNQYPPFLMIGWTPKYYDRLLKNAGFDVVKRFFAFLLENTDSEVLNESYAVLSAKCERILRRFPEIELRNATRANVGNELREINRIGNRVRSRGFGFVPNTEAEMDFMLKQMQRIIDPHCVISAYIDNRLVAYNVTIPDVNWALRKTWGTHDWIRYPQLAYWLGRIPQVRLIAVGVDPDIRAKGLSAVVTSEMLRLRTRYKRWEFSWIAEDNRASISTLEEAVPLDLYKILHLYEKNI